MKPKGGREDGGEAGTRGGEQGWDGCLAASGAKTSQEEANPDTQTWNAVWMMKVSMWGFGEGGRRIDGRGGARHSAGRIYGMFKVEEG